MRPAFSVITVAILSATGALSQSPPSRPTFEIADVHLTPREFWVQSVANKMRPAILSNGRYEIRRASMLDLIRTAYSLDVDQVFGGPSWLEYDRFDIAAKAPPATKQADLRLMLQSLLADRFHLVVRPDTKPIPAWIVSLAKGGSKLKSADPSGPPDCQRQGGTSIRDIGHAGIHCRNVPLARFLAQVRGLLPAESGNPPLIDQTGLEGAWDIDLQYSTNVPEALAKQFGIQPSKADFMESLEKQLGLIVELKTAPQPVLSIESVLEQPTTNPPGVAAALPPLPSPEFEIASVKLCDSSAQETQLRFLPGGRVSGHCEFLLRLIRDAWNLPSFQDLPAPKWLTEGQAKVSIDAKAPPGTYLDPAGAEDTDALKAMMRAILIDRFKMKIRYEDRLVDSPTLVAVKPKLTKADPAGRTGCNRQRPQTDQVVCRNITMAQFAEQIPSLDLFTGIYPVLDATGLEGAWDFTLTYYPPPLFSVVPAALAAGRSAEPGQASEPSARPVFAEALTRQLGLKLAMRKRKQRVLVIDSMEHKPVEN